MPLSTIHVYLHLKCLFSKKKNIKNKTAKEGLEMTWNGTHITSICLELTERLHLIVWLLFCGCIEKKLAFKSIDLLVC